MIDPNKTLQQIRELTDKDGVPYYTTHYTELADLVAALDEWLTRNGSLPDDWKVVKRR